MFDHCIDMSGDGDSRHLSTEVRKARVEHQCCECHQPILPGAKYEIATGVYEESFWQAKTCMICRAIRDDLCDGYVYGALWKEIERLYGLGFDKILEDDDRKTQCWDRWEGDDRAWAAHVKKQEQFREEQKKKRLAYKSLSAITAICKFFARIGADHANLKKGDACV